MASFHYIFHNFQHKNECIYVILNYIKQKNKHIYKYLSALENLIQVISEAKYL